MNSLARNAASMMGMGSLGVQQNALQGDYVPEKSPYPGGSAEDMIWRQLESCKRDAAYQEDVIKRATADRESTGKRMFMLQQALDTLEAAKAKGKA